MVSPLVDEIAEPIVEVEEQVIAPVIDMDEDIAMLFEDDDFSDDDSERVEEEETSCTSISDRRLDYPLGEPGVQTWTACVDGDLGAGFVGSCTAERYTDSTAADYSFRDEQLGEHADAVHFGDG
nr:hypothetical protein [Tanacetum cinerariifolium]